MSLEQIYNQHKDLVFNLSLNYSQNREDAEEITQDVFVSVYDNLNKFKQNSQLKTWIYRITINKSLDFIKFKNRSKRNFLNSLFSIDNEKIENQLSHFDHPGVQLENKESVKIIFDQINKLSENQRTVIILLKIECKKQAEVAEIMNLSQKAVESLFQRAKKNLEKTLNKTKN